MLAAALFDEVFMISEIADARAEVASELALLTPTDLAVILCVPHRTVMSLVRKGHIRPTKDFGGGKVRFSRDDVRRWIAAGQGAQTPTADLSHA